MPTIVLCGYGNEGTYQQCIRASQARRNTTTASTAAIIESKPMQPLPLTFMFHTSDWDGFAPFVGRGGRISTKIPIFLVEWGRETENTTRRG